MQRTEQGFVIVDADGRIYAASKFHETESGALDAASVLHAASILPALRITTADRRLGEKVRIVLGQESE